ncbi:MAG: hypothetical protein ACP5GD_03025 [Candidatus Micrarchaeia archaeon]
MMEGQLVFKREDASFDHLLVGVIGGIIKPICDQLKDGDTLYLVGSAALEISRYLVGSAALEISRQNPQKMLLPHDKKLKVHDVDINIVCGNKGNCNYHFDYPNFGRVNVDIHAGTPEELFGVRREVLEKHSLTVSLQVYSTAMGIPEGEVEVKIPRDYLIIVPKLLAWKARRDSKKLTHAEALMGFVTAFSNNEKEFIEGFSSFLSENWKTLQPFIQDRLNRQEVKLEIEKPKDIIDIFKESVFWTLKEELKGVVDGAIQNKIDQKQIEAIKNILNFVSTYSNFEEEFKNYLAACADEDASWLPEWKREFLEEYFREKGITLPQNLPDIFMVMVESLEHKSFRVLKR